MEEEIVITQYAVETWMKTVATGEFHYKNVLGLERVLTPREDNRLRGIILELCKAEICESVGRRDGWYRSIDNGVAPLDFTKLRHADFPIILPFDLRKYAFIYPDTSIIVAGSKSSGKTGFIYRTAKLNMPNIDKIKIKLLSNVEGGKEMMYDRFKAMGIDLAEFPKFIWPVSENYHDHIKDKNTIYLIDYIDVPDEGEAFYKIGALVKKVDHKLQGLNSVAVIGLQKPAGRDTAFGKEQTLKVASLYLAMDSQKLKIVDAKVSANKKLHPKNMQWTFVYDVEGTDFLNITPYQEEY